MLRPVLDELRTAFRARRLDEALEGILAARAASSRGAAPCDMADLETLAVSVFIARRQHAEAEEAVKRVQSMAGERGDARTRALAALAVSALSLEHSDLSSADLAARDARREAEVLGERSIVARADNVLAIVASIRGEASAALLRYGSALAQFDLLGDFHNVAVIHCNIGNIQTSMGEAEAALEHYASAQHLFQRIGGSEHLALTGRAQALLELDRGEEALVTARAAVVQAMSADHRALADAYHQLGLALARDGEHLAGLIRLRVAAAFGEQDGDHYRSALIAAHLAEAFLKIDEVGETLSALDEAALHFGALGAIREQRLIAARIVDVRQQTYARMSRWVSNYEDAIAHLKGHAERVRQSSVRFANALRLSEPELRWCELGALLHDIGFASLPTEIAVQVTPVSQVKRDVFRLHSQFGEDRLRKARFPTAVCEIVRHHHERWDGSGYPDRLVATEIPYLARLVAVVERYEALCSTRGEMRGGMSTASAVKRLRAEAGTALDPGLVEIFVQSMSLGALPTTIAVPFDQLVALSEADLPSETRLVEDTAGSRLRLQTILGSNYKITKELVPGGMSRLYLAEDVLLSRRIVVKVLEAIAIPDAIERFRREMSIIAKLVHPQIVPILHAGIYEDIHYFVMPYIDGGSLRNVMLRGANHGEGAFSILCDIAAALAYSHARHVTHRDLKPENVLLKDGRALLADFGIARDTPGPSVSDVVHPRITMLGTTLGTPGYMSPEQLLGDAEPTPAMDVYAFGALAYELLAGTPPFEAPTVNSLMLAHVHRTPKPLAFHRPDLDARICDIVDAALAKEPADRPVDGGALLTALAAVGRLS